MLCAKFDIPKHTIEYASKFSVFPDDDTAKNYQGICTHVNFRPEGKWDLGPWVDWDRITGLANDKVDYVDENPEEVKGMKTQATERYDGSQDNWEYKDTVDPISGEVVETAEAKKMRVLRENNPLICAW